MAGKKRPPTALADLEASSDSSSQDEAAAPAAVRAFPAEQAPAKKKKKLAMELRKQRKQVDKDRHRQAADKPKPAPTQPAEAAQEPAPAESAVVPVPVPAPAPAPMVAVAAGPGLHMNVFRDLASPEASLREAAAEALVAELREVQTAYEKAAQEEEEEDRDGLSQMEAEKEDGLDNCAPAVWYAIRRLIRGISSSREFARQGFALGLAAVLESIQAISVEAVMKLIPSLLEYSASMKGPEAKDNLLGRLFGFGSLARSGRVSGQWAQDKSSPILKDFVGEFVQLGNKKRYLAEPAVALILDLARKLPDEPIISEVLKSPGVQDWFNRAANDGDPDALFLALKFQERTNVQREIFGKLLPYPYLGNLLL